MTTPLIGRSADLASEKGADFSRDERGREWMRCRQPSTRSGIPLVPRLSGFDRLEAVSSSAMRRYKSSRYLRVSLRFAPSLTNESIDFEPFNSTETGYQYPVSVELKG